MVYRMELIENFDAETVHQKVAIRTRKSTPIKQLMWSPYNDIHSAHYMRNIVRTK